MKIYYAIFGFDEGSDVTVYIGQCADCGEAQTKATNLVSARGSTLTTAARVTILEGVAHGPIRHASTYVDWE